MAVPTSRATFKEYCLRKLGKPVIEINVDDAQVEDRIDEALKYYYDYHYDGTEKQYYKHQVTDTDKVNKYITLPENIIGVVRIFPIFGLYTNNDGLFNITYQIALNDLYTLTTQQLAPYYMTMQAIAVYEEILVGKQPIRYNRHMDRVYIDMNWDKVNTGEYLVLEAYSIIDPDVWTDAWGDRWLQDYASTLIKMQWGTNLKKFTGLQLPGGVQFNGQQIYDEAFEYKTKLEEDMVFKISLPVSDMIG